MKPKSYLNDDSLNRKSLHGFTLAELLVVLSILGFLALLLLPVYGGNRQSGLLQCKSNLMRVGWAIEMYSKDNGGYLPGPLWQGVYSSYRKAGPIFGPEGTSDYTTWSMAFHIAAYLGYPQPSVTIRHVPELTCPLSVQFKQTNVAEFPPTKVHISYLTTAFVTNNALTSPFERMTWPFGRPSVYEPSKKLSTILRPSEQWSITDIDKANGPPAADYYPYIPEPVHNDRPGQTKGTPQQRNYLFFDGSVRTAKTGARISQ